MKRIIAFWDSFTERMSHATCPCAVFKTLFVHIATAALPGGAHGALLVGRRAEEADGRFLDGKKITEG